MEMRATKERQALRRAGDNDWKTTGAECSCLGRHKPAATHTRGNVSKIDSALCQVMITTAIA